MSIAHAYTRNLLCMSSVYRLILHSSEMEIKILSVADSEVTDRKIECQWIGDNKWIWVIFFLSLLFEIFSSFSAALSPLGHTNVLSPTPHVFTLYLRSKSIYFFFQKTRRINRGKKIEVKFNETRKNRNEREREKKNTKFLFRCLFPCFFFSSISFRRLSACVCLCARYSVVFLKYKRPKTTAVLWPQQRADKILRS